MIDIKKIVSIFDIQLFTVAFKNLRSQKLRSFLTLLGIVIGIASIIALVGVAQGLKSSVSQQFEALGTRTIIVVPGGSFAESIMAKLKENDADKIESVKGVDFAVELFAVNRQVEVDGEKKTVMVFGSDPKKIDRLGFLNFVEIERGRLLVSQDTFSVILGNKLATKGFKKEIDLKQKITMGEQKLNVVGISKKTQNSFGAVFNNAILMNSKTLKEISTEKLTPFRIFVKVSENENPDEVRQRVYDTLYKSHGKKKDFQVVSAQQIGAIADSILGLIEMVLVGIAAISLLVGGIGIMNTMIMAVMERTREIGVMKAIGATNERVLSIFLMEAALIGLVGGIIGIALGISLTLIISFIAELAGMSLPTMVTPFAIIMALLFSMTVGIVSGIVPARRAAKLDPVEALRYE